MRRDHVVQVADVIAVEMGDQHGIEHERQDPDGRQAHADPAARVDEQRRSTGPDERRRARRSRSGSGLPVPSSTTSIVIYST